MANLKKDIRLQIFVTEKMDDQIEDVAEIMGISKSDVVRYAVSLFCGSWNKSIELVKEFKEKELKDMVKK